jgi:sec-independent protein translocase protein TatB
LGRFQRYANQVKSDISREMQLEDIKKMQSEIQATAADFESSVKAEVANAQAGLDDVKAKVEQHDSPPSSAIEAKELQRLADEAEQEAAQMEAHLARSFAPPSPEQAPGSEPANSGPDATPLTPPSKNTV